MHHFGEDMTKGWIDGDRFRIEARHHTTGATITMTGPTTGVFADSAAEGVDDEFVRDLAGRFARFLRDNLNSGPALKARTAR
jgi:hypothetical protein